MLKGEKRESQKFKKRYGPRRHKLLGLSKWARKNGEANKQCPEPEETHTGKNYQ